MKKALLFIILAAATVQLKAQNTSKAPASPLDQLLKLKPADTSLQKFIPVLPQKGWLNNSKVATLNTKDIVSNVTAYNMPVAKTYSNDRMPVVKTDEPGVKYPMLIKKLGNDSTVILGPAEKIRP